MVGGMVRKKVMHRTCDRCPKGKEKTATKSVTLPVATGDRYRLDLCDDHDRELDRVIMSWARLGELLEHEDTTVRFGPAYRQDAIRLSTLRSAQSQVERFEAPSHSKAMHLTGDALIGLPPEAADWVFTDHAIIRMRERGVTAVKAMKAACEPTVKRAGKAEGTEVRRYDDTKVVVNYVDMVILTVAKETQEERKAQ